MSRFLPSVFGDDHFGADIGKFIPEFLVFKSGGRGVLDLLAAFLDDFVMESLKCGRCRNWCAKKGTLARYGRQTCEEGRDNAHCSFCRVCDL